MSVPELYCSCPMNLKPRNLHKCMWLLYKYLLNSFGFDFTAVLGDDKPYGFSASQKSNTLGMGKSQSDRNLVPSQWLAYLLCYSSISASKSLMAMPAWSQQKLHQFFSRCPWPSHYHDFYLVCRRITAN